MTEQEQISRAIEECIGAYLSRECEQQIAERYGAEIAAQVRAIYDDAMGCPLVDWRKESMDSALSLLWEYMNGKYPWLSEKARTTLNFCYIMSWK